MLGLTFEKLLVILVIVAFAIGPDRLPAAAAALGGAVRRLRAFADDAGRQLRDEAGVDLEEWKRLDPRRYDPRRIIQDVWNGAADEKPPPRGDDAR